MTPTQSALVAEALACLNKAGTRGNSKDLCIQRAIAVLEKLPTHIEYTLTQEQLGAAHTIADEQYCDDDVEIDDFEDTRFSEGEEGVFVSAWVWVSHDDMRHIVDVPYGDEEDDEGRT